MAEKFEQELERIIRRKSRETELQNLLRGYRICARSEGKSPRTIQATATAIASLGDFLDTNHFSTDVTEIGPHEIRSFILHLGQVRAYEHHPYSRPRDTGLSGHTVNCYLRAIRAKRNGPTPSGKGRALRSNPKLKPYGARLNHGHR